MFTASFVFIKPVLVLYFYSACHWHIGSLAFCYLYLYSICVCITFLFHLYDMSTTFVLWQWHVGFISFVFFLSFITIYICVTFVFHMYYICTLAVAYWPLALPSCVLILFSNAICICITVVLLPVFVLHLYFMCMTCVLLQWHVGPLALYIFYFLSLFVFALHLYSFV